MPRLIFGLRFTLEVPEDPPESITQLIVNLDASGQSEIGGAKAIPPKERVIDLRIGDWIRTKAGKVRRILKVETYGETTIEDATKGTRGYVVREGKMGRITIARNENLV